MKYYNSERLVLETYATSLYENFLDVAKQLNPNIEISFLEFLLMIKMEPGNLPDYCVKNLNLPPSFIKFLEDRFLLKENGKYRYPKNIFFIEIEKWDDEKIKRFALEVEEKKRMVKKIYS